ncbi:MAG: sigma-54-dependent Fis family transcriptional regulator [Deltaproteobacteria bacterium]|nr:sigma-54-dependent Fis family transcriptional regulator [Deltaproteobacteria bacterium]
MGSGAMTLASPCSELLGVSAAMVRLRAELAALARVGFHTVLVQGESGVGKEVVTEALRRSSPRAHGFYEVFDCPAVPEDHLESELFGTARGAFPGAIDKRGALERAHGGIVFFDEIAAMRRDHQAKILRAIEGKAFRRVGGSAPISVDVAVIAAAHEDLASLAASGTFRQDLYYRLVRDGVLLIPPLRERREDVGVLTRHYIAAMYGRDVPIEPDAVERLCEYHWPGNVRQLHTVLRVALRVEPETLSADVVTHVLHGFGAAPTGAVHSASAAGLRVAPVPAMDSGPAAAPNGEAHVTAAFDRVAEGHPDAQVRSRWLGFHAITARIQRRALLEAYEATAGNKTAAGVLLGFHLSPGEEHVPGKPLTESRRNLALRKFRYWSSRLGIAASLTRRPSQAALADLCHPLESDAGEFNPARALDEP